MDDLELKKISEDAIGNAVERAEHYRLLNDPEQAESVCLDVLAVDEDNQQAKRILILALTDRFADKACTSRVKLARQHAKSLTDDYERAFHRGVIHECEGRAYLAKGLRGSFAYECFEEAMELFEEAMDKRAEGQDDAILRWNSCLRTVQTLGLEPRGQEDELPLE